MENEIMNYEEEAMEPEVEVETEQKSGIGTGAAMLLGAGLTLAVGAMVQLGKKLVEKCKAKKLEKENQDSGDEQTKQ